MCKVMVRYRREYESRKQGEASEDVVAREGWDKSANESVANRETYRLSV